MEKLEIYRKALEKISKYGIKPNGETELQRIKRLKSIADKALALCEVSRSLPTNTDYLSAAKDTLFEEHQNRLKKQVKR